MKEFYNFLKMIQKNAHQSFCIATVIEVIGSAYRHEGAKMLFCNNGQRYGTISGGCLEEDLQVHTEEVLYNKLTKIMTYDLRAEDDIGWGQGAGCNGKVRILLESLQWGPYFETVFSHLEIGKHIISVRKVKEGEISTMPALFFTNGEEVGTLPFAIGRELNTQVMEFIREERPLKYVTFSKDEDYLMERLEGEDFLYIFGAGMDVEPVVRRAAEFSFSPIVIDPRETRCNERNFPNGKELIVEHPERYLASNEIKENSYVLIMNHHFERDRYVLNYLQEMTPPLKYVGILGPRERTKRLLGSTKIPEWLHSPVGVDIHAEGAEEISISILAELIKERNKRRALSRKRKWAML
ncbi:xanthine dehydrogenase accessory factor [Evansella vedderi]|uniref:Xanthine dehydrogenase accessory factor n=1 Tax=Evansella vedderi TaxID=38282 RepID=A0ABT9ZQF6_9BACI|nr:XdhC family protein [Evansella vedderi]MDQ0253472.1 xanthine dehydrogenase accessory factor [Evansella vedderi]